MPDARRRSVRGKPRRSISAPVVLGLVGAVVVAALAGLLVLGSPGSKSPGMPAPGPVAVTDAGPHVVDRTSEGPRIHFTAKAVDFGTVPLNTEVSYAFSFANVGTGTLRLRDVSVRVLEGC